MDEGENLLDSQRQNGNIWLISGLIALSLFQVLSTLICFKTPLELFRAEPIINIDWCSQYYWSYAGRKFFSESHRLWGFDPYYMAGYPLDFIFNSSTPVQVLNIIFFSIPPGLVIKWFFVFSFFLPPFIFYFALRNFGLDKSASLTGSALGVSYFWLGENALFGNWGMLSGALILNFFLLVSAKLFNYLKNGGTKNLVIFILLLTLSVLIHKTFFVLIGLPCLILIIIFVKKLKLKNYLGLAFAGTISLVFNLFWLVPFFQHLPNKIEDPSTTFFQNQLVWRFLADLIPYIYPGVQLGRLAILLPGIYGLIQMRKSSGMKELFRFIFLSCLVFFVFVYFGSFSEILRHLQPYRYLTSLFFLLLPSAGFGLKELRTRLNRKFIVPVFWCLLFALQFVPSFRGFYAVARLTSELPKKVLDLHDWIEKNTDMSARIMMEDINKWEGKTAPYGASRFVGFLPAFTPRFLIGGPLPNAFIKHHYASFHDGIFLDKKLADYSDKELKEKLELYNIHWAVAWTEESKDRLRKFQFAIPRARFEDLEVFEFQSLSSWFLAGNGLMSADYDNIELKELKPENGVVVIKMHWLAGFKPEPECELFRVEVPGDPIGFIGLKKPAQEVLLRYEP